MRNVLTCAVTLVLGLGTAAPAAAAPAGLPGPEQLRQALLTVADLPPGLTLVDSSSGATDDSDFADWDRCGVSRAPEVAVAYAAVEFGTAGRGEDVSISLMIGATGAATGRAIVAANAIEADGCPGVDPAEQAIRREPMPAFGDASLGVTFPTGESRRPRGVLIAQGDVLTYLVATGLDRLTFAALARTCADRLARHFT